MHRSGLPVPYGTGTGTLGTGNIKIVWIFFFKFIVRYVRMDKLPDKQLEAISLLNVLLTGADKDCTQDK